MPLGMVKGDAFRITNSSVDKERVWIVVYVDERGMAFAIQEALPVEERHKDSTHLMAVHQDMEIEVTVETDFRRVIATERKIRGW